jgi:hypothetical protein
LEKIKILKGQKIDICKIFAIVKMSKMKISKIKKIKAREILDSNGLDMIFCFAKLKLLTPPATSFRPRRV